MSYTTLNELKKHNPPSDFINKLSQHLGELWVGDDPILYETILEATGLNYAIWSLRTYANKSDIVNFTRDITEDLISIWEQNTPSYDYVPNYIAGKINLEDLKNAIFNVTEAVKICNSYKDFLEYDDYQSLNEIYFAIHSTDMSAASLSSINAQTHNAKGNYFNYLDKEQEKAQNEYLSALQSKNACSTKSYASIFLGLVAAIVGYNSPSFFTSFLNYAIAGGCFVLSYKFSNICKNSLEPAYKAATATYIKACYMKHREKDEDKYYNNAYGDEEQRQSELFLKYFGTNKEK
jgi:hypothetical protein